MPTLTLLAAIIIWTVASDTPESAEFVPDVLLGPYALLAAALIAVAVLWRSHAANDKKREEMLDLALEGWRAQTAASEAGASALEEIARILRTRARR